MEEEQRLELAEQKLSTARLLVENDRFEDAVSRAYYSMFHSAKALLLEKGSDPRTHAGISTELGKLYRDQLGKELTRDFSRIQEKREKADYGEITDIAREEADEAIEVAEEFLSRARDIIS